MSHKLPRFYIDKYEESGQKPSWAVRDRDHHGFIVEKFATRNEARAYCRQANIKANGAGLAATGKPAASTGGRTEEVGGL